MNCVSMDLGFRFTQSSNSAEICTMVRREVGQAHEQWKCELARERKSWQDAIEQVKDALRVSTASQTQWVEETTALVRQIALQDDDKWSVVSRLKLQLDEISKTCEQHQASIQELFTIVRDPVSESPEAGLDYDSFSTAGNIEALLGRAGKHHKVIETLSDLANAFNDNVLLRIDKAPAPDDQDLGYMSHTAPQSPQCDIAKKLLDDIEATYQNVHEGTAELVCGFRRLVSRLEQEQPGIICSTPELESGVGSFFEIHCTLERDATGSSAILDSLTIFVDAAETWTSVENSLLEEWISAATQDVDQVCFECAEHGKAAEILISTLEMMKSLICFDWQPADEEEEKNPMDFETYDVQVGRVVPRQGVSTIRDVNPSMVLRCQKLEVHLEEIEEDDGSEDESVTKEPSPIAGVGGRPEMNEFLTDGVAEALKVLWADDMDVAGSKPRAGSLCIETIFASGAESIESEVASLESPAVDSPSVAGRQIFVAKSSVLQPDGPGVAFRSSPSDDDICSERAFVPWGSIVYGTPVNDNGWLKVGKRYLPMQQNGVSVLSSPAWKPRACQKNDAGFDTIF